MFLLIPSPICNYFLFRQFTFHYVSTYTCFFRFHSRQYSLIYIPLCFYLYALKDENIHWGESFTFHYVSTYTLLCSESQLPLEHLHSTMFLLIRRILCRKNRYKPNLHSTMFLLIPAYSDSLRVWRTFTFHYVSTYTIYAINKYSFQSLIYIPLCFYLYVTAPENISLYGLFTFHYVSTYTAAEMLQKGGEVNLHSTMFLLIPAVQRRIS